MKIEYTKVGDYYLPNLVVPENMKNFKIGKYGKLRFVTARKARVLTGYGTISADGSLFSSFKKRAIKGLRSFTALFYSKNNYEDENSNLIK